MPRPTSLAVCVLLALSAALAVAVAAGPGATSRRGAALAGLMPADGPPVVPHELLAQQGGVTRVMRRDGDVVWMGLGPRLVALDVVDPHRPTVVGRSSLLPGTVLDLAVASLEPNSSLDGASAGTDAAVAWALVAGDRLVALDLADRAAPSVLGSVDVATSTVGIARVGDGLWAATAGGELIGYDVSDPLAPRPAGRIAVVPPPQRVIGVGAVPGRVVAETAGGPAADDRQVHVFDVRLPSRPSLVGRVPVPGANRWHQQPMYVGSGHAWVLGSPSEWLVAVDVDGPGSPSVVGRVDGRGLVFELATRLVVSDGRAYVTGGDGAHNWYVTTVVDVSDPRRPQLVGQLELPRTSDPSGGAAAHRNVLWYGTDDGHHVAVDARKPLGSPDEEGFWWPVGRPPLADLRSIGDTWTLDVADGSALIGLGEAVLAAEASSPRATRPITTVLVHHYPRQVEITGDAAYVTCEGEMDTVGAELHALDIRDMSAPAASDPLAGSPHLGRLGIEGTTAVVAGDTLWTEPDDPTHGDLVVLDVSSPLSPTVVGSLTVAGGIQDVAVVGRIAYAGGPHQWSQEGTIALSVVDVSRPTRPVARGRLDLHDGRWSSATTRLAVDAATRTVYLYGSLETDRGSVVHRSLHVIDARDPDRPVRLVEVPVADEAGGVAAAHGYVMLAGRGGVLVYDVRTPSRPGLVGTLPVGGDAARDVRVEGSIVYVPAGAAGLYTFQPTLDGWPSEAVPTEVPEPATPTAEGAKGVRLAMPIALVGPPGR